MNLGGCDAGFTLVELLATTLLITALLGVAALLIRPKSFDADEHNTERRLAVIKIADGLSAYKSAHGSWPSALTTTRQLIGSDTNEFNICADLVPAYLHDLPLDPTVSLTDAANTCADSGTIYVTGYAAQLSSDRAHVTVSAPYAEAGAKISLTR